MTSFTMRLLVAAAAGAAAAGSAAAQTLAAEIPMPFTAGGTLMQPGAYDFTEQVTTAGRPVLTVRDRLSSRVAILFPFSASETPKAWRTDGTPRVTFECLDGNCTLRTVWNGKESYEYEVPAHRLRPAEKERLAIVAIALVRTE